MFIVYVVILEKVVAQSSQPFRPHVPTDACSTEIHAIMARCWHETPDERPSADELLSIMKKICKYAINPSIINSTSIIQDNTKFTTLLKKIKGTF